MLAEPRWEQHCQSSKMKYSKAESWPPPRTPAATEVGKSDAFTYPSTMRWTMLRDSASEPKSYSILRLRPQLRLLPSPEPNTTEISNMHHAWHRRGNCFCGSLRQDRPTKPIAGGRRDGAFWLKESTAPKAQRSFWSRKFPRCLFRQSLCFICQTDSEPLKALIRYA